MAEHGTAHMYKAYKCRCDACREAQHQSYLRKQFGANRKRYVTINCEGYDINKLKARRRYQKSRRNNLKQYSHHVRTINWREIADKFEYRCALCGEMVDPNDWWYNENGHKCFGRKYPSCDHIVPISQGGTDTLDNVQLAHKQCNSRKGYKLGYVGTNLRDGGQARTTNGTKKETGQCD